MNEPHNGSPYDRIGGEPSVREAVERLYRLILDDEALAPYFASADLSNLKQHMVSLLTKVLGGPDSYQGRDLVTRPPSPPFCTVDHGVIVMKRRAGWS